MAPERARATGGDAVTPLVVLLALEPGPSDRFAWAWLGDWYWRAYQDRLWFGEGP